MLTMLSAVVIAATALAMALLCGALAFPLPSGQARNPQGSQPSALSYPNPGIG